VKQAAREKRGGSHQKIDAPLPVYLDGCSCSEPFRNPEACSMGRANLHPFSGATTYALSPHLPSQSAGTVGYHLFLSEDLGELNRKTPDLLNLLMNE